MRLLLETRLVRELKENRRLPPRRKPPTAVQPNVAQPSNFVKHKTAQIDLMFRLAMSTRAKHKGNLQTNYALTVFAANPDAYHATHKIPGILYNTSFSW